MKHLMFVLAIVALSAAAIHAQHRSSENYYAAGNRIDITTPIDGDAIIAGRLININEDVSGDVLAAGWRITLSHRVSDDVRIAGAEVNVNAPIDGDLTAAGGDVTVGKNSHITGRVWLTGGTIRVDGVLDRETQIAGGTVQITGEIRQPLRVTAEKLEILPTAHILSSLNYNAPAEAIIAKEAQVTGPIAFHRIAANTRGARWGSAMSSTLFAIHVTVAGLVLLMLLPRFAAAGVETLKANPLHSFFIGFAMLVTIPIAALLLVVTVLGAPVGLTLAALYLIGLLLGILTTASYLGQMEARWFKVGPLSTRSQNALALIAGTFTLALLRALAGGVVVFVAVLFGFGALALLIYRSRLRFGSTGL
jgi:cytoskeletal protein CcmA (bactofilin family)